MKFGKIRGTGAQQVLRDFGELFQEQKVPTVDSSRTSCLSMMKFGSVMGLAI